MARTEKPAKLGRLVSIRTTAQTNRSIDLMEAGSWPSKPLSRPQPRRRWTDRRLLKLIRGLQLVMSGRGYKQTSAQPNDFLKNGGFLQFILICAACAAYSYYRRHARAR